MIVSALIDGRPYTFNTEDERQTIGEGGEAIVMKWTPPREFTARHGDTRYAVKLFFEKTSLQIATANLRQAKLRNIPKGLPQNAITPACLATHPRTGRIIGYVMTLVTSDRDDGIKPLSLLMDKGYRKANGITQEKAVQILKNLHTLILGVHRAGVIIGDFNDKNVLVNLDTLEVFLIDVDSAQWGAWPSLVATTEFSDPLLLSEDDLEKLKRGARYSEQSDWYSFTVMAYQLLTLSHPYRDGVHRPKQVAGQPRVERQRFPGRVTTRLSVFDATVGLDKKKAHPPASLPEEMGLFMRDVFVHDKRESPFPFDLLTTFRWMTCHSCGREHGRYKCPSPKCGADGFPPPRSTAVPRAHSVPPPSAPAPRGPAPAAPKAPAAAQSNTTYVAIASGGNTLRYVHHSGDAYRREDGTVVWQRAHDPLHSVLVAGDRTVFSVGSTVAVFNGSGRPTTLKTQQVFGKTAVAANSRFVYWMNESSLVRDDGHAGTVTIGTILPNHTSVWAGEKFGVALVQAGALTEALFFDAAGTKFHGSHVLPHRAEPVIDATCVVSDNLAWLVVTYRSLRSGPMRICYVFNRSGRLLATEIDRGNRTWLSKVSPVALAAGEKLLVPIAGAGIARIGITGSALTPEGIYRDSAQLITAATPTVGLSLTTRGLMHVGQSKITRVSSS